jgi:hypothetical protein
MMKRFLCCCCFDRRQSYKQFGQERKINESELTIAYGQLIDNEIQPVRDLVVDHMDSWSWLMNRAVNERNVTVMRRLVNDCGVHVLYWPMTIYCDAAARNDVEIVDLFLDAIIAAQPDPHYCMSRSSQMLQHAAEGGHFELVCHIESVMRCRMGFLVVQLLRPAAVAPSIAAKCSDCFAGDQQVARTKAMYQ